MTQPLWPSAPTTASTTARQLVDKLWSYCNVLRDDGVSVIEYVEQLTFLVFLKMAHERAHSVLTPERLIPAEYDWQSLLDRDGAALEVHYTGVLKKLGTTEPGTRTMLGEIFAGAQNRIADPAKLHRLIADLIDKENWSAAAAEIKGNAYEELLAKGAEDIKSGAGQYFTPRSLIEAMVDCVQPRPDDTVCDPACGTGGFLLAAHEYVLGHNPGLDPDQREHLQHNFVRGVELVRGTARLALMNLLLHGIGSPKGQPLVDVRDALLEEPKDHYSLVLTNPPFGRKSSFTMIGEDGGGNGGDREYGRGDFWVTTSNKQLNFVQHIASLLAINGRAAVVVPDNVLFEGGAGERIRRKLLDQFDVHTLLRLPTGIFYAGGVKANVLFFDKRRPDPDKPATDTLWVYDFRTDQHFTLKQRALRRADLDDFVAAYMPGAPREDRRESERFRAFSYDDLARRDKFNLDITWLSDSSLEDSAELPPPEVIAAEIVEDLQAALGEFNAIAEALQKSRKHQPEPPPEEPPPTEPRHDHQDT